MKNKPKNPIPPDPAPARRRPRLPQLLRLTGFALALSVLLVLFALLVVGLPPDMTRRITDRLVDQGIPLRVKSIRLSMHHGWVLDDAALYSTSPDDLQPLLKAHKLYVMVWPADWKNLSGGGWHIRVYVKNLGISLGRPWENELPEAHPFRTISLLDASLNAAPGRFDIEASELRWGNIRLLAHGSAAYSGAGKPESPQGRDFRRRIAKAADALSQLKCWKSPEIILTFNYSEQAPEQNFMEAYLSAEGIAWQNRVYERLFGALEYRNNTWTVPSLQLNRSPKEQLLLSGSVNLGTGVAQASVANTLSAADLFSLLPPDAQSAVAQTGIKPYGRFDFTAAAGPAPVEQLAEKIDVQIQKAQLKRQDITLDPLAIHLVRDGNRVEAGDIQTIANGGPLAGEFHLDLDSKAWSAHIKAQCDPLLAGDYDPDLKTFLSRFHFPSEMPKIELDLSQAAPDQPTVITGPIAANRFYCGGVLIDHLDTVLVYSNSVVDLTPIHAVRGSAEQFDGNVQVDFTTGIAAFNATNSFPPADVARALAPNVRTVLENIRFDGPVYAYGHGQVDYRTWTNHSFNGAFRAENIGFGKAQASLLKSDVSLAGTWMTFTNSSVQLYSGLAEGTASFDISFEDGTAPYRIDARLKQIDLAKMLQQISSGGYNRTSGQLSTSFNLSADAAKGFWNSVQGEGRVKIENGRLADVPLFGGFSRLIQSAFPGFNLFSLTTFSADYTLHDRAVWSDNAQVGGTLLSARGRGSYSPETGLNFVVAAEPFRQSSGDSKEWYQLQRWAADAVKEGTAPLFRLLEFQLDGPIDKPEWRFVNLPKDVTGALHGK